MGETTLLWRKCVSWLRALTVICTDDAILQENATFDMFAQQLRDGVLLCRLAAMLSKHSPPILEQINWSPNLSKFLCTQNIMIFLYVCGEHFGIDNTNLFKADDLYRLQNLHEVLKTLALLSQNPNVKTNFPHVQSFAENSANSDEIYVVKVKNTNYANIEDVPVKPMKTKMVIAELIQTEKLYLQKLEVLRNKFMDPLRDVVSPEIFDQLSFYKTLAEKHYSFLKEIEAANTDTSAETRLCHVMMKFRKENLHIYRSLAWSREMVTNQMANPEEKSKTMSALEKHCKVEELSIWPDVLQEPNKRLVSYRELLKTLLRNTAENDPCKKLIEKSEKLAKSSIVLMEHVHEQSNNYLLVKKLKGKFTDLDLPPGKSLDDYGMLMIEGAVTLIEGKKKERQRTACYAFLFQKLLLLSEAPIVDRTFWTGTQGRFKTHRIVLLSQFAIEDKTLLNKMLRIDCFKFRAKSDSDEQDFSLKFKSKDADIWKVAMKEITENQNLFKNKFNTHKFELTSFDQLHVCGSCRDFLVGITGNFKCRSCKMIIHKECISLAGHCVANYDSTLTVHNWFAGAITRDESNKMLRNREIGTYLVRVRPFDNAHNLYAFSVKTEKTTKNARIVEMKNASGKTVYGFEGNDVETSFPSISQMIAFMEVDYFYKQKDAIFPMCEPVRAVWALVIKEFEGNDLNEIRLVKDDIIIITSKECDSLGWWRGKSKNNGRPGFFPKTFVEEMPEIQFNTR